MKDYTYGYAIDHGNGIEYSDDEIGYGSASSARAEAERRWNGWPVSERPEGARIVVFRVEIIEEIS